MGNCGSTFDIQTCSVLATRRLDGDPSIVGVGMLISFVATAFLTFAAMILGYFTKSLPEHYLNDVDHEVIRIVGDSWVGTVCMKLWTGFVRISRKCLFLSPPDENSHLSDFQRRDALKSFLLALSDQQLVTGIALLIAGYANWCTTSTYELNMVVSLAWFSAATHLATLDVLREYFQKNRIVRNWRIVGMVIIMILLIVGLLITAWYITSTSAAPAPCARYLQIPEMYHCNKTSQFISPRYSRNTNVENTTLLDAVFYDNCVMIPPNWFTNVAKILVAIPYLLYGYASAISRTMVTAGGVALSPSHVFLYFSSKMHVSTMEAIDDAMKKGRQQRELTMRADNFREVSISRRLEMITLAYIESFLSRTGFYFFNLSYGLSQLIMYRSIYAVKLQKKSKRIDFGQIASLVLLILPILAATEIFHENDDSKDDKINDHIDDREENNRIGDTMEPVLTAASDEHQETPVPNSKDNQTQPTQTADTTPLESDATIFQIAKPKNALVTWEIKYIYCFHVFCSILLGFLINFNPTGPVVAIMTIFLGCALPFCAHKLETFYIDKARAPLDTTSTAPATQEGAQGIELPLAIGQTTHTVAEITHSPPSTEEHGNQMRTIPLAENLEVDHGPSGSTAQALQSQTDDGIDHEDQSYAYPNRQDTESGLRRLC